MKRAVELNINGDNHEILVSPNHTLLEVLRDKLGLMGTKRGCDLGACGACTVLINGEAYLSCVMLAVDAVGKEIMTIEGLSEGGELHPLQRAFVENGGLQCGFCTPGMILTAKAILNEDTNPTEKVIKKKMAGNLCRCTGYKKILEAVMSVTE
jgi:carbon-monoxide dehydrogenase small subunit